MGTGTPSPSLFPNPYRMDIMSFKAQMLNQLNSTPLGFATGESNFQNGGQAPENYILRIKNYSDRIPRKVITKAVSLKHNVNEAAKKEGTSTEDIRTRIGLGEDFNTYKTEISPIIAKIVFDGNVYLIPLAASPEDEPPAVNVPPGIYDLYLGNPQRMSGDSNDVSKERERLMTRFAGRENPAIVRDENGKIVSGYLDFILEEVSSRPIAMDRDSLTASDIREV